MAQGKIMVLFIICLWFLIIMAYSSSFTATWHLDDFHNIVRNEKIHFQRVDLDSLTSSFFAGPSGRLYRPLPMASFGLNWYFGGSNVYGYHLVNTFIHCINSLLLYLIITTLLQVACISNTTSNSQIHWIALITTALWALNPLQIQAITYIVQRMASMAAMFYLAGIYLFLKFKKCSSKKNRYFILSACFLSYLLAILSKENALLFPLSIYLIENIFFNSINEKKKQFFLLTIVAFILLFSIIFAITISKFDFFKTIDSLYSERSFTALQRLMTEPRVLFLYLTLIFLPHPSRLSLSHDITLSTTLFQPWTTLPAIILVVLIISLSIIGRRRKPLVSFAFLFFFLNHVVESTFLPLELVFEHRNYLPAAFIFLPVVDYFVRFVNRFSSCLSYGKHLAVGVAIIPIFIFSNWTFTRNMVWHSEKSLWEDEIIKNPNLARPYHNLAWGYYQARGKYDEALTLYNKALTLKTNNTLETAGTLNNMGRIYYLMGKFDHALVFFQKSKIQYPQLKISEYQEIITLIQLKRWGEALEIVESALNVNKLDPFYLKIKGIILIKNGDYESAVIQLGKSLNLNPMAADTRSHLAIALGYIGRFDEAINLFPEIGLIENEIPVFLMALAEVEKVRGNYQLSDGYLQRVIDYYGFEKTKDILLTWKNDQLMLRLDYDDYLVRVQQSHIELINQ